MRLNPKEFSPDFDLKPFESFPEWVEFEGKRYWATKKVGTHFKTGQPSAEYKYAVYRVCDERVWRLADGTVERD